MFQSPSLRGSGRFCLSPILLPGNTSSFNPLHCGAVVASFGDGFFDLFHSVSFQSPSLRGSGRFPKSRRGVKPKRRVSIPFIAGQWSLPDAFVKSWGILLLFQSPSLRGSGRFFEPCRCFCQVLGKFQSPSLRGSGRFREDSGLWYRRFSVSIPFIAGQWSLLSKILGLPSFSEVFQSPSLRGSGRFTET